MIFRKQKNLGNQNVTINPTSDFSYGNFSIVLQYLARWLRTHVSRPLELIKWENAAVWCIHTDGYTGINFGDLRFNVIKEK